MSYVHTLMFLGVDARRVEVQVGLTGGLPSFSIVGLADKTVGESRERIRSALAHSGLSLPPKRITVNLSPADLIKEGSHFDLPIALSLLVALGVLEQNSIEPYFALGELSLDGRLLPVAGIISAALAAHGYGKGLLCPATNGGEAAWVGGLPIVAVDSLAEALEQLREPRTIKRPQRSQGHFVQAQHDFSDLKGQESARRCVEIAAAGGHNLLMLGTPGAGKSMLAERMPTILPPMTAMEILETARIQSIAGAFLNEGDEVGGVMGGMMGGGSARGPGRGSGRGPGRGPGKGPSAQRPFRSPHHSASLPALVGGGRNALPGEISLAHNGVLFLDELPEFSRQALEALRQPLESGSISVARAHAHVTYPARFQLIAAMNPCRCGYLEDPKRSCRKAPLCAEDYQKKNIRSATRPNRPIPRRAGGRTLSALARQGRGELGGDSRASLASAREADRSL